MTELHVVSLCTGNAARSVMAGVLLEEHVPGLIVTTYGTHVIEGVASFWPSFAEAEWGLAVTGERDNRSSLTRGAGSHGEAGL